MPHIALAAAGAALTSVGAQVIGGVALTAALTSTTTLFAAVSAAATGFLSEALAPSVKTQGVSTTVRQSAAYRQVVYGRRRVSGVFVYIDTNKNDRDVLHLCVAWAGHEIEEVEAIYMGDRPLWKASDGGVAGHNAFSEVVEVRNRLGSRNQQAIDALVSEKDNWTAQHRLRGIAYSHIRMVYDPDVFPQGLTNLTAIIKGKKCYDPRDGSTAWTENPALCLRDYLTNSKYGVGLSESRISDSHIIAMANLSDETITSAGGSDDRYRITGVFDESAAHRDVIQRMLGTMNARAVWSGGKFMLIGGAYEAPDVAFDEGDIVGPVRLVTRVSVRDRWNEVIGRFPQEGPGGKSYTEKQYMPFQSDAYQAADNGRRLTLEHDLPWTPTAVIGRRIAKVILLQSRQQIVASVPLSLKALSAIAGGGMTLTVERYGWSAKEFEITDFQFSVANDTPSVVVQIRETSSAIWDWSTSDEAEDPAGEPTGLPDAFEVQAPLLTLSDDLIVSRQEIVTVLSAAVTSADPTARRFEAQARIEGETQWRPLAGQGGDALFELQNAVDGETYEVRARAINGLGIASAWATSSHTVVGKIDPPADVTGFRCDIVAGQALLTWSPVADLDLSHYEIRHQQVASGAVWGSAAVVVDKVARPANSCTLPAKTGTWLIKAVDKLGKTSAAAATALTPVDQVGSSNLIDTVAQSAPFAGSGTAANMLELYGGLTLARAAEGDLFDDLTDVDAYFDDIDGLGAGDVIREGSFTFDDVIDLGGRFTLRLDGDVTFSRLEFEAGIDSWDQPLDSYEANFDSIGVESADGDATAWLEVRTTDDDPSGSPTWSAWRRFFATEITARAFQPRVVGDSTFPRATPLITSVSIVGTMIDRSERAANVASGAGSKAVTFGAAFYDAPAVMITPIDLPTGGYVDLSPPTASGFTVTFYNAAATAIDTAFNWRAEGYGEAA